jgi:hypothetical protein
MADITEQQLDAARAKREEVERRLRLHPDFQEWLTLTLTIAEMERQAKH